MDQAGVRSFIFLALKMKRWDGWLRGPFSRAGRASELFADYMLALPNVNTMSADKASATVASISLITLN